MCSQRWKRAKPVCSREGEKNAGPDTLPKFDFLGRKKKKKGEGNHLGGG